MYSLDAPQIIEHTARALDFTPFDARWVPSSPRFVVLGQRAKGTGVVALYELTQRGVAPVAEIERPAGVKCGTFGASPLADRKLAAGDYKGELSLLDLDDRAGGGARPAWSVKAHDSVVNAVDGCGGLGVGGGAPELVTGGRDGLVKVWDPRLADPVATLRPADGSPARDVWTVAFGNSFADDERAVAAGYDNGDVKLFDLRTMTMRWEANVGNGVVCAEFDRKDIEMNKLVVTCLESKFTVFDLRTQHAARGFAGATERAHKATVWLARHLPQNRDVWMTSGGNGGVNLYRYHYPPKRAERDGEGAMVGVAGSCELLNARLLCPQPIVGWDWSPDKEGLACAASLDQQVRVFLVTRLGKV